LTVTPGVKATVSGSAEVSVIGFGKVSAAAVGVEANVTLADVSIPITASVSSKANPLKHTTTFTESLRGDLAMNYLSGHLDVYFKTVFPIADGDSWWPWKWDMDKFTFTILEWDGRSYNQNLVNKSASQDL
jgi:hypothetical protein